MATTEHTINDALAGLLRGTRYAWRGRQVIRSETTQLLVGSRSRPDILVAEPYTAAVIIETEVLPALTVEAEALSRLGETLGEYSGKILSSIAIRLPRRFREAQGPRLEEAIKKANDLEFALYTGKSCEDYRRHPQSGWISGSLNDLSLLVQSASVPPSLIDEAANQLEIGVNQAAAWLEETAANYPGAMQKIAAALHQQDGPQTRRMAAAILANALMFHEHLANGPGDLAEVRSLDELRAKGFHFTKSAILLEWLKILRVNYWSIFDISKRILALIPTVGSFYFITNLTKTAQKLATQSLMRSHDLTGAVFQRLIADRKFLAAFYTTPASAALLVGLAIDAESLLTDGDWGKPEKVKALRIADFACGTGTLLSTAYQRISQLHELHGGDSAKIHAAMMERALVGCDILPAATHLTASMLSGAHPQMTYEGSAIFTQPYGLQEDGKIALGSIDLLKDMALLEGSQVTAKALEGGGEAKKDTWRFVPHGSFDMVIMNPPFTRATNHEGSHAEIPNPVFAAFGSSAAEQKAMAKAAKQLTRGTIAHGNAGEASTFMALADRKLRIDGTLALVMPLTFLTGSSWEKCRARLAEAYEGLILISILGTGGRVSFSADTSMAECLVIGQRSGRRQMRAVFVILNQAPDYAIYSIEVVQQIRQLMNDNALRRLEDGPTGGNALYFGNEIVGQAIDAPLPPAGGWKLARIADLTLAQSAYQMVNKSRIWLPTQHQSKASDIPMTTAAQIGEIGPYHLDVSRRHSDGTRRPFELRPLQGDTVPTYPILSAHNADRERTMMFGADHDGIPYRAADKEEQAAVDQKIADLFATASHCHSNLDFGFSSQSTSMQFTKRKTIGGRAWISIQLPETAHEKALVLWANTTLGLLMFWWHSSKQQSGRGILTKTTLQTLPILDVTALDDARLEAAARLFDEMNQMPLRPLHELDSDDNRKTLDRRFYGEALGLDDSILADGGPLDILRQKLCREPSIRGSKK